LSRATDDDITTYLTQDEVSRLIAIKCLNGTTTNDIFLEVMRSREKKGIGADSDDVRSITSSRLQNMEKLGILTYDNQFWKTTEKAKVILRKYFGMV
jgi:hypothetical protein